MIDREEPAFIDDDVPSHDLPHRVTLGDPDTNSLSELLVEQERLLTVIDNIQEAIKNPETLADLCHLEMQLTNHKLGLLSVRLKIENCKQNER